MAHNFMIQSRIIFTLLFGSKFGLLAVADDFYLKSKAFETIEVTEGDAFTLECTANKYLRSCTFFHEGTFCRLQYFGVTGKLVKNACTAFNERLMSIGDYDNHECLVRIFPASIMDQGKWRCELKEYVSTLNILDKPERTSKLFNVTVKEKPVELDFGTRFGTYPADGLNHIPSDKSSNFLGLFEEEKGVTVTIIVIAAIFGLCLSFVLAFVIVGYVKRVWYKNKSSSPNLTGATSTPVALSIRGDPNIPVDASDKALDTLGILRYKSSKRVL